MIFSWKYRQNELFFKNIPHPPQKSVVISHQKVNFICFRLCRERVCRVSKRCNHATVWYHKNYQIVRKIWVLECKNIQFLTVLPFLGKFCNFLGVFCLFCLPKTFRQKCWLRQKNLLLESLAVGFGGCWCWWQVTCNTWHFSLKEGGFFLSVILSLHDSVSSINIDPVYPRLFY